MMNEHSSKQYDLDLEQIRSKVLLMGGIVERQLQNALFAFRTGNSSLAAQVIDGDKEVNTLEITLDDDCSHLIVRRQPAANDLRSVMATIKAITDLERIGDESVKIARSARNISDRTAAAFDAHDTVRVIAERATDMLRRALDAFSRQDITAAGEIFDADAVLDRDFRAAMRTLATFMMEDPRSISAALDTLWAAKALERIGDHTKNLAEYVIYMVEGKDVRHQAVT